MPRLPESDLDPELIEETVSRFRHHRPAVETYLDADPSKTTEPYRPYDLGTAAVDVLFDSGNWNHENEGSNASAVWALAEAAAGQTQNAELILQRRQKAADMLNRAFRRRHGIVDQQG